MVPLLKAIVRDLCSRFFSSAFSFCNIKGYYLWKYRFYRLYARIRLPDCSKLAINLKNDNGITIFRQDVILKFFWSCLVSLVKFTYLYKFHVNIITGSGVMTISFYKGLTLNLDIGNTQVWILPSNWGLARVKNIKFGTNIFNKILINAAKCQSCSFYRFSVIKGKVTGGG